MTIENAFDLPRGITADFISAFLGERIGEGISREVFKNLIDPTTVLKFETGNRYQNVLEWELWKATEHMPRVRRWLAPCVWISGHGTVLCQKRTGQVPKKRWPAKAPVFLSDFKRQNFGWFENRLVCHDYGLSIAITRGLSEKLRKVDWWGDEE